MRVSIGLFSSEFVNLCLSRTDFVLAQRHGNLKSQPSARWRIQEYMKKTTPTTRTTNLCTQIRHPMVISPTAITHKRRSWRTPRHKQSRNHQRRERRRIARRLALEQHHPPQLLLQGRHILPSGMTSLHLCWMQDPLRPTMLPRPHTEGKSKRSSQQQRRTPVVQERRVGRPRIMVASDPLLPAP